MRHRYFMEPITRQKLILIIGLILAGIILFVTGVLIERSGSGTSAAASTAQGQTSTGLPDADGGQESTSRTQRSPSVQTPEGLQTETVFGLDLENPWFVTASALIWLGCIAALVRFGRITLPAVLLMAVLATVLDAGEVVRQIGEAKSLLATVAALVTAAHAALVLLVLFVLIQGFRPRTVQAG